MIVTFTPNPSLDRTMEIHQLVRGGVLRAGSTRAEPGGKGVNVARALHANGYPVRTVLPTGGPEGDHLLTLLEALDVDVRAVPISDSVRTNLTLVEPNGTVTKINAAGPRLIGDEPDSLIKSTVASLEGARWVAACGSLAPGSPEDLYAALTAQVQEAGVRVAVDTSGAPLDAAIVASPDLIKPNADELAAGVGRALQTFDDVVAAAEELRRRGARAILVSLGPDGAMLVDDFGAIHAEAAPVVPRSNVGAGDATLAGFIAGEAAGSDVGRVWTGESSMRDRYQALRQAVAWGSGAVSLPGTAMPGPEDLDVMSVRIHEIDPGRRLTEGGGGL